MFGNGLMSGAVLNDFFNHNDKWHDISEEQVRILGVNEFSALAWFDMGCV